MSASIAPLSVLELLGTMQPLLPDLVLLRSCFPLTSVWTSVLRSGTDPPHRKSFFFHAEEHALFYRSQHLPIPAVDVRWSQSFSTIPQAAPPLQPSSYSLESETCIRVCTGRPSSFLCFPLVDMATEESAKPSSNEKIFSALRCAGCTLFSCARFRER